MSGLADIKKLRDMTLQGINDCKKALQEAKGDFDKALKLLRERGVQIMDKKQSRTASQGIIDAYVHFGGNLGSLVEVNCETDFVARTEVFKKFVKDIAMQVAAASPDYVQKEDIPKDVASGISNIDEYVKDKCLMNQQFVKDGSKTITDYLRDVVSQTGENIVIKRFERFVLGESDEYQKES